MELDVDMDELSEDERLARLMGFRKFKSTKNTKVPGNEYNYAVRKEKQTKYRQYMNRQGGFNRPLSPTR
jgi:U4/U6.U5 tri-snRNP-associated protein 3